MNTMSDTKLVLAEVQKIGDAARQTLDSHKNAIETLTERIEHLEAMGDRPRGANSVSSE